MKKLVCFTLLSFFITSFIKAQTVFVNSDGTHSVGIDHGSTTTVINPDGIHSVGINHGDVIIAVNPDGTHSVGINHSHETTDHASNFSRYKFSQKTTRSEQEDTLFAVYSKSYKEEVYKLKILISRGIIRFKEYRSLKKLSLENESRSSFNKANQVYELHQLLASRAITAKEFRLWKREIIETSYH